MTTKRKSAEKEANFFSFAEKYSVISAFFIFQSYIFTYGYINSFSLPINIEASESIYFLFLNVRNFIEFLSFFPKPSIPSILLIFSITLFLIVLSKKLLSFLKKTEKKLKILSFLKKTEKKLKILSLFKKTKKKYKNLICLVMYIGLIAGLISLVHTSQIKFCDASTTHFYLCSFKNLPASIFTSIFLFIPLGIFITYFDKFKIRPVKELLVTIIFVLISGVFFYTLGLLLRNQTSFPNYRFSTKHLKRRVDIWKTDTHHFFVECKKNNANLIKGFKHNNEAPFYIENLNESSYKTVCSHLTTNNYKLLNKKIASGYPLKKAKGISPERLILKLALKKRPYKLISYSTEPLEVHLIQESIKDKTKSIKHDLSKSSDLFILNSENPEYASIPYIHLPHIINLDIQFHNICVYKNKTNEFFLGHRCVFFDNYTILSPKGKTDTCYVNNSQLDIKKLESQKLIFWNLLKSGRNRNLLPYSALYLNQCGYLKNINYLDAFTTLHTKQSDEYNEILSYINGYKLAKKDSYRVKKIMKKKNEEKCSAEFYIYHDIQDKKTKLFNIEKREIIKSKDIPKTFNNCTQEGK